MWKKKKNQLQLRVSRCMITQSEVMPELYESKTFLILKEESFAFHETTLRSLFFLHCRSSPVTASCHASALCWNTMLSEMLFPDFAAVEVQLVFGITILLHWWQTSWWATCETRQISAQFSLKLTRFISQSTTLLNLKSCPRKKLKMQRWRSIYRYSLSYAEY